MDRPPPELNDMLVPLGTYNSFCDYIIDNCKFTNNIAVYDLNGTDPDCLVFSLELQLVSPGVHCVNSM